VEYLHQQWSRLLLEKHEGRFLALLGMTIIAKKWVYNDRGV
jgi:hypothetical protein